MAKNMIRKSLAAGTAGALSLLGLAVPAQAAISSITVSPVVGTSTNGVLGANFVFAIAAPRNAGETVSVQLDGISAADVYDLYYTNVDSLADGATIATDDIEEVVAGTEDVAATIDDNANDDAWFTLDLTAGEYTVVSLSLDTAAVDDTTSVSVTVFEEDGTANGIYNSALEDGKKSNTMAIKYINPADLTGSVSVVPTAGDTTGAAVVTISGVNMASIAAPSDDDLANVVVTYKGDEGDPVAINEDEYDADENYFYVEGDFAVADNFVASTRAYAKAYILAETDHFASSTATVAAGQTDVVGLDDLAVDAQAGLLLDGNDVTARSGDGSLVVSTTVLDADDAGVAGAEVVFTISETGNDTLDADAVIKAGGKTLANEDDADTESVDVTVVADADGVATLTIDYTDLANADDFTVDATVSDEDAIDQAAGNTITVTGEDSAVEAVVPVTNYDSGYLAVKQGSAVKVAYQVIDQFGLTPDLTMRATWEAAGGEMLADKTDVETVASNGTFSASWTDNSQADDATATLTVTEVEYKDADGDWQATGVTSDALTLSVTETAASASEISIDAIADGQTMELADITVQDERVALWAEANDLTGFAATATATDADGVFVVGVPVTFSGAGLYFSSNDVYSAESITVYTDDAGEATVQVYSNTAGDATLKATSGSASDTEDYTYDAAADDTGDEWVITAAEYAAPGSTFTVVATLKDAYGNTVTTDDNGDNWVNGADAPTVEVSYSGPGVTVGTSPDSTNDKGQLKYYIFLGSNDSGTGTVTISYTTDGDVEVVEEVEFTVGTAPAVDTGVVNAGSFNGYVAVYAKGYNGHKLSWRIAGVWFKTDIAKDYVVFQRKTVAVGLDVTVKLYIDGVEKLTKVVTTK